MIRAVGCKIVNKNRQTAVGFASRFYFCIKIHFYFLSLTLKKKRIVISGGPGAGKSTLIKALHKLGYPTHEEYSRTLIDAAKKEGQSRAFLSDPHAFSEALFIGRKQQYEALHDFHSSQPYVFFDRGIHDIYAYLKAIGKDTAEWHKKVAAFQYDLVFLLSPWEAIYKADAERTETFEEAEHYFLFIEKVYKQSHKIIYVPHDTVDTRISFIIEKLNEHG